MRGGLLNLGSELSLASLGPANKKQLFILLNPLSRYMPTKYNPNQISFTIEPELRERLQTYVVKRHMGMRGQSKALNELIDKALKTEGL
jgi:hypothetical protein